MAAAAPVQIGSIRSESLYYGKQFTKADPGSTSAEEFYVRMDTIRQESALTDPQAIVRLVGNLRGDAHTWWRDYANTSSSLLDLFALNNTWAYFTEHFKTRYFIVSALGDTVADIADIKQKDNEDIVDYLTRLATTLRPTVNYSQAHTRGILLAQDINHFVPQQFRDFMLDPVAHAIPAQDHRTALLGQVINTTLEFANETRSQHVTFEHVGRTAARMAKDTRMKRFIRKKLFTMERNLPALMMGCKAEEKSYENTPFTSGSGKHKVSAMDNEVAEVEFHEAHDEETEEEDGEWIICAVSKKPKFIKNKKKKGPPINKKTGKPFEKKGGANTGADNYTFKCPGCRVQTHEAKDCRKLRKAMGLPITGPIMGGPAAKSFNKPFGGGGRPHHGGRGGAEDMDTSAMQQQQYQPQQYHNAAVEQPAMFYDNSQYDPYNTASVQAVAAQDAYWRHPPPAFHQHGSGNY
jgi:hypothetical protein